jgi:hypothetical protein
MLSAMVEARRREEEELQREAERAMAKRKKFKEVRYRLPRCVLWSCLWQHAVEDIFCGPSFDICCGICALHD